MTDEEERAADYRQQCERREEFQQFLAGKLKGSDTARRVLCLNTKPLLRGEAGDTSDD